MSVLSKMTPFKFSWHKIPDDKLPEGRISVPFSLVANFAIGDNFQTVNWSGISLTGLKYDIDLRTVAGVQNLSAIKSLSFFCELSTATNGVLPSFVVFVPDSGQLVWISPKISTVAPATSGGVILNGALPIISNNTKLEFMFLVDNTGNETVQLQANANNFEMDSYTILPIQL